MSDVKLGTIIDATAQRDAIHIAIAPVIAGVRLSPGEHVGFVEEGNTEKVGPSKNPIGIVDPFLRADVKKGDRFYLFLFQNTVTSLRHEWTHPAFRMTSDKNEARAFIAALAEKIGSPFETFDDLMAHVKSCIESENCFTDSESMRYTWYENQAAFWKYYEVLTGKKRPEYVSVFSFSCSC